MSSHRPESALSGSKWREVGGGYPVDTPLDPPGPRVGTRACECKCTRSVREPVGRPSADTDTTPWGRRVGTLSRDPGGLGCWDSES